VLASIREGTASRGASAVTSCPLLSGDGPPLGVVSTHFERVHAPSHESLHRLEFYARRAAGFIERCRFEQTLRKTESQLQKLQLELD
jgi:hypothetical protein